MSLIYLASPYSHPDKSVREERYRKAFEATMLLLQQGYLVYSPIVYTHPLATLGDFPLGFAAWKALDLRMLDACDTFWILPLGGYSESVGIKEETDYAVETGKSVAFVPPSLRKLMQKKGILP